MRRWNLLACLLLPALVNAQPAGKRLEPASVFPERSLAYLSIESIGKLRSSLATTLTGRLLTHPAWRDVFAGLTGRIQRELAQNENMVRAMTGKSLGELLSLVQGGVVVDVLGISPEGLPEVVVAVEVAEESEDLLGVVARLRTFFEENVTGGPLDEQEIGSVKAAVWPTPQLPLFQTVLGDWIVISTSGGALGEIVQAYDGKSAAGTFAASALHRGLAEKLTLPERQVSLELDLAAIVQLAGAALGEQAAPAIQIGGLTSWRAFGYTCGVRNGRLEGMAHLALAPGGDGVIEALGKILVPIDGIDGALAHVPSKAATFEAVGLDLVAGLTALEAIAQKVAPPEQIDAFWQMGEDFLGFSVREALLALPRTTLFCCTVSPPAGGFFDDQIFVLPTDAFRAYLALFEKVGTRFGGGASEVRLSGVDIERFRLRDPFDPDAGLQELFSEGDALAEELGEATALAVMVPDLYSIDLDGGWTVVSTTSQSTVRYALDYGKSESAADDERLAGIIRRQFSGAAVAGISKGGHSLVAAYNSLLQIASIGAGPLAMVGIDLAYAPPGEAFAEFVKPGTIRCEVAEDGFTVHGRGWLSSSASGPLVAIGGISVVAGFAVPTLLRGREEAYQVQCANNLKQIFAFAIQAGDKEGRRVFPHETPGEPSVLERLADEHDFSPRVMQCPVHDGIDSSYEFVPWPVPLTGSSILAFDTAPRHRGQRVVLYADNSVRYLAEDEFQRQLAVAREEFAKE